MPASAITSASPSFATCTPTAPASTCRCAIWGSLCVFVCGRTVTPASRACCGRTLDVRADDVEVDHDLGRVRRERCQGGCPFVGFRRHRSPFPADPTRFRSGARLLSVLC